MGDLVSMQAARAARPLEPLLRDVVGRALRELRHEQGERLVETAARAGISPQYLSEVERGRKDPSSEMFAAITGALGTDLVDLTRRVTEQLSGRRALVVDLTPQATRDERSPASASQPQLLALAA